MNRKTLSIVSTVLVVVLAAVIWMLVSSTSNDSQTSTNTTPETTSTVPEATPDTTTSTAATITYTDDGFSPSTITVKKGDTVKLVNNSSTAVQFSSADHPAHTENPELNQDELAPDASQTFTVSTVGAHGYHDHFDDSHTGTIIVTE